MPQAGRSHWLREQQQGTPASRFTGSSFRNCEIKHIKSVRWPERLAGHEKGAVQPPLQAFKVRTVRSRLLGGVRHRGRSLLRGLGDNTTLFAQSSHARLDEGILQLDDFLQRLRLGQLLRMIEGGSDIFLG